MNLQMYNEEVFEKYKSNAQRVRILSEDWTERNLFCISCLHSHISRLKANTPVVDFICDNCQESFQLKSQSNPLGRKVLDGAFFTMIQSIRDGTRPNFLFLQYDSEHCVQNLLVVPSFFFLEEVIEKRKPLSEKAQRKGWIRCNILIEKVPEEGRIPIIENGLVLERKKVNARWKKIDFMKKMPLAERGWTIDVLNSIHAINKNVFSLEEVYKFESQLALLHPDNHHVKDKIRQQVQILRDKGFLQFDGNGRYTLE